MVDKSKKSEQQRRPFTYNLEDALNPRRDNLRSIYDDADVVIFNKKVKKKE